MNPILSATFELIKSQVLKYIVSKVPILGGAFLNPLLTLVVNHILKIAFEQTSLAIYFVKVDAQTKEQADRLTKSQQALLDAKTNEEKEKARNDLKNNLRGIVRLNK